MTLKDGRVLEYTQFGDPNGFPIMFHHGFMCTNSQVSLCHTAALKNNVRIIAPHRPGYGNSSVHVATTPRTFAHDIQALVIALGIKNYATTGTSGGTAFAFGDAIVNAGNVQKIIIVSGLLPFKHKALKTSQSFKKRLKYKALGMFSFAAKRMIRKKVRQIILDPKGYYDQLIHTVPPADKAVLQQPEVRAAFIQSFGECAPNGVEHLVREYMTYWRWGFSEQDLPSTIPLYFFHGTKDRLCAFNYVQEYSRRLPQSQLIAVQGGHFAALNKMDVIFDTTK